MRFSRTISVLILLSFCAGLPAQTDSSAVYLSLLQDLVRNGNFENAQIESLRFRSWLDKTNMTCPAEAVPLLNGIYQANKDVQSAYKFLNEAEHDARYDRTPETRAKLLKALVKAFEEWEDPARALSNQKVLDSVRDSLLSRQMSAETKAFALKIDSLEALRRQDAERRPNMVYMERSQAIALAVALLLLLSGLLVSNYRAAARWRKRLLHKDIEMDLLRANLRPSEIIPPFVAEAQAREQEKGSGQTYFAAAETADQTALLIEPNRQVVLYLKSILSDRFQVDTAFTAAEGIQMANRTLPDLIVCDAVLNGQTGIDVTRQLKLSDKTNHIPVILLSERYGNDGKLDALRAGAEAWFTRPMLDTEFDKSVLQLMQARKDRQSDFARFLHLYFTADRQQLNDAFLSKTIELVERSLNDPDFMADDLARKMQLTNHHFAKKLRVLTGKEPAQIIREMRLEKAKVLLENRAALPQNVAELVGFSNAGSFAMAFKEYFGENTLLLR